MRAVIARELERAPRDHVGYTRRPARRARAARTAQARHAKAARRTSPVLLTARTASPPSRLARSPCAVAAAAASITAQNTASGAHGIARSMLQWNDCRFTTWIRIRLMTRRARARPRAERADGEALGRQHGADLPLGSCRGGAASELAATREHQRAEARREAGEPDHQRDELEHVGDRERAIERLQRALPDLARRGELEESPPGTAARIARRPRPDQHRRRARARRRSRCGRPSAGRSGRARSRPRRAAGCSRATRRRP